MRCGAVEWKKLRGGEGVGKMCVCGFDGASGIVGFGEAEGWGWMDFCFWGRNNGFRVGWPPWYLRWGFVWLVLLVRKGAGRGKSGGGEGRLVERRRRGGRRKWWWRRGVFFKYIWSLVDWIGFPNRVLPSLWIFHLLDATDPLRKRCFIS